MFLRIINKLKNITSHKQAESYFLSDDELFDFRRLLSENKHERISINKNTAYYGNLKENKHNMYMQYFMRKVDRPSDAEYLAGWGINRASYRTLQLAAKLDKPFLLFEDGFVRSVYTWSTDCSLELKSGVSYTIDASGAYFDASQPSDLEKLLNSYNVNEAEKARGREIIDLIVKNNITKYNNQPIIFEKIGKTDKDKVLVVDQSYGDMSLKCGFVDDAVFSKMVNDAVNQNPDAEILFKIHPDTITKNKESGFLKLIPENVTILDNFVNPIALIKQVRSVYVATSQFGFEALLCGKPVFCYGMPFYAGWGLTDDKFVCERRKKNLSIEEMAYIVYDLYCKDVDPIAKDHASIDQAVDFIVKERQRLIR